MSVFLTIHKKNAKILFFLFSHHFGANTWYLQRFVAVHCGVHCSVHCACTVRALCKTRCFCTLIFSSAEKCNFASGGVEAHSRIVHHARHTASDLQFLPTWGADAAMLLLCLWAAAVKMKVCLDWGFGTCKREFVQACVCTSINQIKQICCVFVWWVAALKMKVRLD